MRTDTLPRLTLTPREREILAALLTGATNARVAAQCGISLPTVKHHLQHIFDKTGVSTRLELAMYARFHMADPSHEERHPR